MAETICKSCGFINPESSQYCTLCGVPFIPGSKGTSYSEARSSRQTSENPDEVDFDTILEVTRSTLKPAESSDEGDDDELDGLLSDFDGTFPNLKD